MGCQYVGCHLYGKGGEPHETSKDKWGIFRPGGRDDGSPTPAADPWLIESQSARASNTLTLAKPSTEVASLVTAFHDLPTSRDQAAFRKAIEVNGAKWHDRMTAIFQEGTPHQRTEFIDAMAERIDLRAAD
jgi:hypothetical protein